MNFEKNKKEIENFLIENFENLKRRKVSNSGMAFNDLLVTEYTDTNNAIRSIMKKIIAEARTEFVNRKGEIKGYDLGEHYKHSIIIPQLDKINIDFKNNLSDDTSYSHNYKQQSQTERLKSFQSKSPIHNVKKKDAAVIAGTSFVGTAVVGTSLVKLLTPIGLSTSLIIGGISAIVVGGIVYTILSIQDEHGTHREVTMNQPASVTSKSAERKLNIKTLDKASVDQLLDARRLEAELAVSRAIDQAEKEYNNVIEQLDA